MHYRPLQSCAAFSGEHITLLGTPDGNKLCISTTLKAHIEECSRCAQRLLAATINANLYGRPDVQIEQRVRPSIRH